MAFVDVPNTVSVRIFTGTANLLWSNTWYFYLADFTLSQMQNLTEDVFDAWADAIKTSLDAAYSTRSATSYDLGHEEGDTYTYSPTPVAGTDVGEELPVQDAMVVTLRTNFRGRAGRGRLYIAGFNESALQNGVFITSDVNTVLAACLAVKTAAQTLGWQWGIAHRYENGAPMTTGEFRSITTYDVRSTIPGVQRRRSRRP